MLSEVLNVQSELSEESSFTIGRDACRINFTIAELMLGLFCFVMFLLYLLSFIYFSKDQGTLLI